MLIIKVIKERRVLWPVQQQCPVVLLKLYQRVFWSQWSFFPVEMLGIKYCLLFIQMKNAFVLLIVPLIRMLRSSFMLFKWISLLHCKMYYMYIAYESMIYSISIKITVKTNASLDVMYSTV